MLDPRARKISSSISRNCRSVAQMAGLLSIGALANEVWYLWKRNNWILDPRSYLSDFRDVPVDRPIFLLGVQGGGLTLLSRMLRRHPDVVSVSGNSDYWSGADEMHTVLGPLLPSELTGARYKVPWPNHPVYAPPRSWTYASDDLLPFYRKTANDANDVLRRRFQRLIRLCIARHARDRRRARFIDKSQVYTVRVSLLRELLKDCRPRFVLVAVNPYASCYRAALGKAADMRRLRRRLTFQQRLDVCAQHWANSMRCALEDRAEDMVVIRLEDLLNDPVAQLRGLCDHLRLDYSERLLPRPDDRIPFGSRFSDRWYPLDPARVLHYVDEASPEEIEIIDRRCGRLALELGYQGVPRRGR